MGLESGPILAQAAAGAPVRTLVREHRETLLAIARPAARIDADRRGDLRPGLAPGVAVGVHIQVLRHIAVVGLAGRAASARERGDRTPPHPRPDRGARGLAGSRPAARRRPR